MTPDPAAELSRNAQIESLLLDVIEAIDPDPDAPVVDGILTPLIEKLDHLRAVEYNAEIEGLTITVSHDITPLLGASLRLLSLLLADIATRTGVSHLEVIRAVRERVVEDDA